MFPKLNLWFARHKGLFKLFFFGGILLLLVNAPYLIRKAYSAQMDSETIAIVDTLIQNQGIAESMTGGKVLTKSYDITYHYEVNGRSYQSSNHLDRVTLTIEQRLELKRLQKGDTINIKYPSHNPSKSILEI